MAFNFFGKDNIYDKLKNKWDEFRSDLPQTGELIEGFQQGLQKKWDSFYDDRFDPSYQPPTRLPQFKLGYEAFRDEQLKPKFQDLIGNLRQIRLETTGQPPRGSGFEQFSLPNLTNRFKTYMDNQVEQFSEQMTYEQEQIGSPRIGGQLETPGSRWLRTSPTGQKIRDFGIPINKPLSSFLTSRRPETIKIHPANLLVAPQEIQAIDRKLSARQPLSPEETKLAQTWNTQEALGFALDIGAPRRLKTAQGRLTHLLNYEDTLRRKGFTAKDTANIGFNQAQEIIKEGISPENWRKGVKPAKFKGSLKQKITNFFNPLKNAPPEVQDMLKTWRADILTSRAEANKLIGRFKHISDDDGWKLIRYIERPTKETAEALSFSPSAFQKEIKDLRTVYDYMRDQGIKRGLDVGYIENYLNHVWKEPFSEIAQKVRGLGKTPAFAKQRSIPSYSVGIDLGLTPRYTHPAQLAAHYNDALNRALANKKLVESLVETTTLLPASRAPLDWLSIDAPLFPKHSYTVRNRTVYEAYKAPPDAAIAINNIFNYQAGGMMEMAANISRLMQDVTLSGGIPKTPVNAFALGNMVKDITAGRVRSPVSAFLRSFSPDVSRSYFAKNGDYLRMMADEGVPTYTNYDYSKAFKNIFENKAFKQVAGEKWQEWISSATFRRFMPQLQLNLFKDVYEKGVKNGINKIAARKLAGKTVKNFYGITDSFTRSKFSNDSLTAVFFAPKFREAMVDSWFNNVKAITTNITDPAFKMNRRFLAGTALTYALYSTLNKALNGRYLHENKTGKEFFLEIPRPDGRSWFIPILPSIGTLPRRAVEIGANLLAGDIREATQKFGTLFSQPLNLLTQLLTNRTFYGGPIYDTEDPALTKLGKLGGYAFEQASHPFVGEPMAVAQGRKTPLEAGMGMLELPVYPSKSSYNYVKGLKGPMGDQQRRRYNDMIASGMDQQRATDIIQTERLVAKARKDEKAALTSIQKDSVRSQALFKLDSLKQESETGSPLLTGNLELDTLLHTEAQKQLKSDAIAIVKNAQLTETEKRKVLESKGLDYETTLNSALKGLETQPKAIYVLTKIRSVAPADKTQEALRLAEAGILTNAVVAEWLERGIINTAEKKAWQDLIKMTKGTFAPGKGKKFTYKKPPTLKVPKTTPRRISAPRLKTLPLRAPRIPTLRKPKISYPALSGVADQPLERAPVPSGLMGATKKLPIRYAGSRR